MEPNQSPERFEIEMNCGAKEGIHFLNRNLALGLFFLAQALIVPLRQEILKKFFILFCENPRGK